LSWWCNGSASDSWLKGRWFDSQPGRYQVNQVNSAFHPSGVAKSNAGHGHLCRVAGNTVWSHIALRWEWGSLQEGASDLWSTGCEFNSQPCTAKLVLGQVTVVGWVWNQTPLGQLSLPGSGVGKSSTGLSGNDTWDSVLWCLAPTFTRAARSNYSGHVSTWLSFKARCVHLWQVILCDPIGKWHPIALRWSFSKSSTLLNLTNYVL